MTKNKNMLAQAGLRFFGKMSASATHEIKNTLSIINESAGLLEDLSLMAQKGQPLSIPRINDISQSVARQVKRSDMVLSKLNRFSHSVDKSKEFVDLEQTIVFVLDLATRLLEMQGVSFKVISPDSPLKINISLFYLENIIWQAIEAACNIVDKEKQITISFGIHDTKISIGFEMTKILDDLLEDLLESDEDKALMRHLDISIEKGNKGFALYYPKNI
jgi:C4-dicarboxylate-specific signal transduction histidine kinase